MKKYIVIERGSRGEIEDVEIIKSEKEIKDFCEMIYERKVESMKEGLDEDELDELDEELDEWGGVSLMEENVYEVCIFEELSYEVYEVK